MNQGDPFWSVELQQITVAAVRRAAGRGLLTAAEAEALADRIHGQSTTSPSSIQDGQQFVGEGLGERS